ncbi:MAG: fatty acid desaturase [Cyanobacteriota bacterium]
MAPDRRALLLNAISSPSASPSLEGRPLRRKDFVLEPYLHASNARAVWQLLSTLVPVAGLWLLVAWIGPRPWAPGWRGLALLPVLSLLVLFSARTFSLMHDCGHGALFRSRLLNRVAGFLLGVINAIPQHPWSRGHAFHHRHNGNWERYRGPSALVTLEAYRELSPRQRWLYGLLRQPVMLLPGGFFYLVIKPRLALLLGSGAFVIATLRALTAAVADRGWRALAELPALVRQHRSSHWYTRGELADLVANNLLVIASWWLMGRWLGVGLFWSCYALVMACSAAIFICIFFVQHNFADTYAHGSGDWNVLRGAVEGSSNLELPWILHWFSADIGFHSIHHLCERIPNYRLRACHERNAHLLKDSRRLGLVDIPGCFAYILWDQANDRLTTLAKADATLAAGSTPLAAASGADAPSPGGRTPGGPKGSPG